MGAASAVHIAGQPFSRSSGVAHAAGSLLRWLRTRAAHRKATPLAKSFVDRGRGIERRYAAARQDWEIHLSATRDFIRQAFTDKLHQPLHIHGAGNLLDFPEELLARGAQVLAIDADPLVWRESHGGISYLTADVTGVLETWSTQLAIAKGQGGADAAREFLLRRQEQELVVPRLSEAASVVALNLLGQLPLYWRDEAARILESSPGVTETANTSADELQQAVEFSMGVLQRGYLQALSNSAAQSVVLITDETIGESFRGKDSPQSSGMYFAGVLEIPGFSTVTTRRWRWQIVPESAYEPGTYHTILAMHLTKDG